MATVTTNLGLIEAANEALINKSVKDYLPDIHTTYFSGLAKNDTYQVQIIAGTSGVYDATTNNYLNGGGSVVNVDVLLNKHAKSTFRIKQEEQDKVAYADLVNGSVDAILKQVYADIWSAFVAGTFADNEVIGASSAFDYAKFVEVNSFGDERNMDGHKTLAIAPAYVSALISEPDVAAAMSREGVLFTGKNRLTLLGDDLIKTANIPSTGNVVGAYFDKQALAIVFGSPTLSGKVTPVADAATGFRLYVREVEDVSTGDIAVTVECVYGIKGALTDKAVLLKSAA